MPSFYLIRSCNSPGARRRRGAHLSDEETEAQRGEETCPRSHRLGCALTTAPHQPRANIGQMITIGWREGWVDKRENENVHKPGNKPSEAALLLLTWFLVGGEASGPGSWASAQPPAPRTHFCSHGPLSPRGGEALHAADAVLHSGDVSDQRGTDPLLSCCGMIYRPCRAP